jgi:hypothetical protein
MSQAVATLVTNPYPSGLDSTSRHIVLFGTFSISASPATYVTGGLPLVFANPDGTTGTAPVWLEINSWSGGSNTYKYQAATPTAGATLRIYVAGTELANAAAIPVGVSGDTVAFRAEFNKGF